MFTYVTVPTLILREKPQVFSEVVSQALFSEEVQVIDEHTDWVKICLLSDQYQGWVQKEGLFSTSSKFDSHPTICTVNRLAAHIYSLPDTIYGPLLTLPFESRLKVNHTQPANLNYDENRWIPVQLPNTQAAYIQKGDVNWQKKMSVEEVCKFSLNFKGIPYTWGGRSSFGYDCSGFVQMLYRQMGVSLPRDAKDQIKDSRLNLSMLPYLNPGDLLFFGKTKDLIQHVGFYLGNNEFIHTCAVVENQPYVRMSSLNDPIWNGKGYYPYVIGAKFGN